MKQVKRNKQKIWRKTYGKPFIARKSIAIALMARDAATVSAEISVIIHANTDRFQKGLAIASKVMTQAKNMADQARLLSKGFASK